MITFVVYSHTDFLDILKIQNFYIKNIPKKILLINSNCLLTEEYTNIYDKVIFYDEKVPYASRIKCLETLDTKTVLLIHDNDILIYSNLQILNALDNLLHTKSIDKISLQYNADANTNNPDNIENISDSYNFKLCKQNYGSYLYNVNPTIWNLKTLISIVSSFPNASYREIELDPVQRFCSQFNIFNMHNHSYLNCGYFACLPFFVFLHITHGGKLLRPNGITQYNHPPLEPFVLLEYRYILDNFLKNTSRCFN